MTEASKTLIGIVPTVMAAGLVKHNIDYLKSKKKRKSLLGLGISNIVGANLISATAQEGTW